MKEAKYCLKCSRLKGEIRDLNFKLSRAVIDLHAQKASRTKDQILERMLERMVADGYRIEDMELVQEMTNSGFKFRIRVKETPCEEQLPESSS